MPPRLFLHADFLFLTERQKPYIYTFKFTSSRSVCLHRALKDLQSLLNVLTNPKHEGVNKSGVESHSTREVTFTSQVGKSRCQTGSKGFSIARVRATGQITVYDTIQSFIHSTLTGCFPWARPQTQHHSW